LIDLSEKILGSQKSPATLWFVNAMFVGKSRQAACSRLSNMVTCFGRRRKQLISALSRAESLVFADGRFRVIKLNIQAKGDSHQMSTKTNDETVSGSPVGLSQLRYALTVIPGRLAGLPLEKVGEKSDNNVWSAKEELGHLIDSSANNHQRIVRGQLENELALPGYDGDGWVQVHRYHNRDWIDLIELWRNGNSQLLAAAEGAPGSAWSHKLTIGGSEPMTLAFVLDDYVLHMSHHLKHIGITVDDVLAVRQSAHSTMYPEKPAPTDYPIAQLIARRWSPRAFEETHQIERQKILRLLEAARWSPSCFNDQPRYFLIFDESRPEALARARGCLTAGNSWAFKAPVLLLSVARETFERNGTANRWGQHDTGLATENLLLQAHELGLVAHAMGGFDAERARTEFEIPDGFTPMAMIALGYPYRGNLEELNDKLRSKELASRERKPMSEIAFGGSWGKAFTD